LKTAKAKGDSEMVSVVIVSNAYDDAALRVTTRCVRSAVDSGVHEVIVVEQQPTVNHFGAKTLHYSFPFNYNKCLNFGIKHAKGDYYAACNNDLVFTFDWWAKLRPIFALGYGSLSPLERRTAKEYGLVEGYHYHEGYQIRKHLTGWCFVITKEAYKTIGKFDESVMFWYSDNIYADQLIHKDIKHAIVCCSFVDHVESYTLNRSKNKKELTSDQTKAYNAARRKYEKR